MSVFTVGGQEVTLLLGKNRTTTLTLLSNKNRATSCIPEMPHKFEMKKVKERL